jgi:hypothetical protein
MTHLRPDEYVDAIDETLAAERRTHLAACAECRAQVAHLTTLLGEVREVSVPEPSPLFWGSLSERIRVAVANEGVPRREYRWFQWPVLAPLGALAIVVLALVSAVPQGSVELWQAQIAAKADLFEPVAAAGDVDASWDLMAALADDIDFDTAENGVAILPGSADRAAGHLTAAEQEELVRLLREELQGTGG